MNNTKICRECHVEKPLDCFAKGRKVCKNCKKLYLKEYYRQNKEKHAKKGKEWREKNKEKAAKQGEDYRKNNKEKIKRNQKAYYEKNKEKIKQYHKEYNLKNREYTLKKQKEYRDDPKNKEKIHNAKMNWQRKKLKKDLSFKINRNISSGIWYSLKNTSKKKGGKHWEDIVGYTLKDLISHLESLWEPWMNWGNHGVYNPKGPRTWQVDHIIPKSMFNFESYEDEEFKLCWSLKNLQPKESKKNNSKRARYIG